MNLLRTYLLTYLLIYLLVPFSCYFVQPVSLACYQQVTPYSTRGETETERPAHMCR